MARGPRQINVVSLFMLVLIVGAGYVGYRAFQVYKLGTDIEIILDRAKYEAAELDLLGGDPRADAMLEDLYLEVVALGLDEETTDVTFSGDFSALRADYIVVIEHPFGQTTTLERTTTVKIPSEN